MAQQAANKQHDELDSESIESLWRQAILIRDISRDEIESSRRRRDEA